MKRTFILAVIMAMVLVCSMQAQATLTNLGTDSLGNRLIYDSDLDITWYDYTKSIDSWQNQVNWASGLTVDFGGTIYDDWRLPTTVDGPSVYGYDGTTTVGYNITNSELGHLFYEELGNKGQYDTSGNLTGCGFPNPTCLTNKGFFQHLQPDMSGIYWSGTEYSDASISAAWLFMTDDGLQVGGWNNASPVYAIAVRPGDVSTVPEPGTLLLLGSGLAALVGFRKRLRRLRG
ncbi:MAG: PEP-CTERM sorting domain-containing protein [Nitrospirae bacterium]|nr:PEP-CTERM sorting domain-containing protein [Nitrospirota bacterium]